MRADANRFTSIFEVARNSDFERALAEAPEDVQGYRVYADWLIDQGDPRGELIARSLEYDRTRDHKLGLMIDGFTKRNADVLVGALAPQLGYIRWRHGFFEEVTLDSALVREPFEDVTEAVLALPSAALLPAIAYRCPAASRIAPALAVLGRLRPAPLRAVKLGVDSRLGDLDALFPLALHRLEIHVPHHSDYNALDPVSPATLASLVRAPWPLRALRLHVGPDPDQLPTLLQLVARTDLPHLAELRIAASHRVVAFASTLVRAILASPFAAQLTDLELDLEVGAADYKHLVEQRPTRLPKLTRLEVPRGKFRRRPR